MQQTKRNMVGASLRRWAAGIVVLVLLGLGNAMAAVFEWHNSVAMLLFNGLCVVALVGVVLEKILLMEPRKKWRILSFLVPAFSVLAFIAVSAMYGGRYQLWAVLLAIVGVVALIYGVVCMVRWRRFSLEHKEFLKQQRDK